MEDFASFAMNLSPEDRAKIMAQVVRGRPLQEANQQAHSMDLPALAATMSNNPALAKAAELGAKQRQAQFKPVQMGQQGFSLPATGEFVSSPMFEQEQSAQRASREQIAAEAARARADAANTQAQASLQRAREAIASREQIAADSRALRMTLGAAVSGRASEKKAEADERKAEASAIKLGKDLDSRIAKFTTGLDKAGVPDFESALHIAENTLGKYKGDIPGFGKLESFVPDMVLGDEAMGNRQDMQMAANILLKSRSGAAVTNSEALRFLREVAMGTGMSEVNLRKGWANVRTVFEEKKANLFGGLNPDDLAEYNRRAGTDYKHRAKPGAPAPAEPSKPHRVKVDLNGNVVP